MVKTRAGARQKPRHNPTPVRFTTSRPGRTAQEESAAPGTPDTDLQNRWHVWQKTHDNGSLADYVAWNWLVNVKHMAERADFTYRWGLGTKDVVDFYFRNLGLAWLIDNKTAEPALRGAMLAQLMAKGVTGVQLKGQDVTSRTTSVLTAALAGNS